MFRVVMLMFLRESYATTGILSNRGSGSLFCLQFDQSQADLNSLIDLLHGGVVNSPEPLD
jgi:hypothetical protein